MTPNDESHAGLVPSATSALAHSRAASLAGRGLIDLLKNESAESYVRRGEDHIQHCRPQEAFACYQQGLESHSTHAELQYKVGQLYELQQGIGCPQHQTSKAAAWWLKAAEQGHAEAQCCLGDAYYGGEGVEQDFALAELWWRKAADQGLNKAQRNISCRLFIRAGANAPQDDELAFRWWRTAADLGHAGAQHRLGVLYAAGRGVAKNDIDAAIWYRKAAVQGVAKAQSSLGWLYFYGVGVPQDFEQARFWIAKARELQ